MTAEEIAVAIRQLTARELLELGRLLHDDEGWWEMVGVREPRRPSPESPGDTLAAQFPETHGISPDYADSAE